MRDCDRRAAGRLRAGHVQMTGKGRNGPHERVPKSAGPGPDGRQIWTGSTSWVDVSKGRIWAVAWLGVDPGSRFAVFLLKVQKFRSRLGNKFLYINYQLCCMWRSFWEIFRHQEQTLGRDDFAHFLSFLKFVPDDEISPKMAAICCITAS